MGKNRANRVNRKIADRGGTGKPTEPAPRTVEEINKEYTALALQVGEAEMQRRRLERSIDMATFRHQQLENEMRDAMAKAKTPATAAPPAEAPDTK